ncbi:Secondary metabolite protein [Streptomyces sp. SID3343]|uniref:Secondary metabolite protein n=1 Tax=Streptomyces sp. SID3343 TaxID=2690260 RepID=UPI001372171D|nr:Secondary metabolite protein [Streptomyces sp. SID3343]MYW03332.1 Secondary metabolite protein [Streptomyces sp. SID3343]MYW06262.1 Secondary metabolite protein [Streptomyces sp. SID3343]
MTLAAKLDRLFASVRRPDGGAYSNGEVARGIKEQAGPEGATVSASLVQQLRTGVQTNPTLKTIDALARFFNVEPVYFFDDAAAERIAAERDAWSRMRENDVHRLVFRADGLSADSLRMVSAVIEQARRLEGLKTGSRAVRVPGAVERD